MTTTALILHPSVASEEPPKLTKTVRFEDHGQDFLEFDIEDGKVIDCRPFQASIWVGCKVVNTTVRKGSFLNILTKSERLRITLKYPIEKVKKLKLSYQIARRRLAMTPGSEWVFFRDGDEHGKDRWSGREIRIHSASLDDTGEMILMAELCSDPKQGKGIRLRRRVYYSELW